MYFMMYMLPNGDICHMGDEMGQTFHSGGGRTLTGIFVYLVQFLSNWDDYKGLHLIEHLLDGYY